MDSFEWRRILSKKLEVLTPSRQAAQDCALLIFRNGELMEDLLSVIIETLDTVNLNTRINIFQVIEELLELAEKDQNTRFTTAILNDLTFILSRLLPRDPFVDSNRASDYSNNNTIGDGVKRKIPITPFKGLTNLYSTYTIMCEIFKKHPHIHEFKSRYNSDLLTNEDITNIDSMKPFPESTVHDLVSKSYRPELDPVERAWEFLIGKKKQSQYERRLIEKTLHEAHPDGSKIADTTDDMDVNDNNSILNSATDVIPPAVREQTISPEKMERNNSIANTSTTEASQPNQKAMLLSLSHKRMLVRIEADRERQKKAKENLWTVERPNGQITYDEFTHIFDKFNAYDAIEDGPICEEMTRLFNLCNNHLPPVTSGIKDNRSGKEFKDKGKGVPHIPKYEKNKDTNRPTSFKNKSNHGGPPARGRFNKRKMTSNDRGRGGGGSRYAKPKFR